MKRDAHTNWQCPNCDLKYPSPIPISSAWCPRPSCYYAKKGRTCMVPIERSEPSKTQRKKTIGKAGKRKIRKTPKKTVQRKRTTRTKG